MHSSRKRVHIDSGQRPPQACFCSAIEIQPKAFYRPTVQVQQSWLDRWRWLLCRLVLWNSKSHTSRTQARVSVGTCWYILIRFWSSIVWAWETCQNKKSKKIIQFLSSNTCCQEFCILLGRCRKYYRGIIRNTHSIIEESRAWNANDTSWNICGCGRLALCSPFPVT